MPGPGQYRRMELDGWEPDPPFEAQTDALAEELGHEACDFTLRATYGEIRDHLDALRAGDAAERALCGPPDLTEGQVRAMYPGLNDRGVQNYLLLANRVSTSEWAALLVERSGQDRCLLQPRVREGTPWLEDCLVHGVPGDADHYFRQNPGASTE